MKSVQAFCLLLSLGLLTSLLALPILATEDHHHEAEEAHHHDVVGTIRAVTASSLELGLEGGKVETFQLTAAAEIKRGDAPARREELKVGIRVVVMSEERDGKEVVVEVNLDAVAHEGHED